MARGPRRLGQGQTIEADIAANIDRHRAGLHRAQQKIDLLAIIAGPRQDAVFDQVVAPFYSEVAASKLGIVSPIKKLCKSPGL